MCIRARKQIGAAKKKRKTSSDVFELNEEVRIHDMNSKIWKKVGKIIAKREADDEQNVSYVIELENGHEKICHQSHFRHNVTHYTPVTEKKVKFTLEGEYESKDKEKKEEVKKTRGRPKKGEESKSETDDITGTLSRTQSEIPLPDPAAQPSKSF